MVGDLKDINYEMYKLYLNSNAYLLKDRILVLNNMTNGMIPQKLIAILSRFGKCTEVDMFSSSDLMCTHDEIPPLS